MQGAGVPVGPGPSHCRYPACKAVVRAPYVACAMHWFLLPKELRSDLWACYRSGQAHAIVCTTEAYRAALKNCVAWWAEHHAARTAGAP